MSRNNMSLSVGGDGEVRLSYWDSVHGDDRHFILRDDGALEESCIGDTGEGMEDVQIPVNLYMALRTIALELEEEARQEMLREAGL